MYFEVNDVNSLHGALLRMCRALEEQAVPQDAVYNCRVVANELLVNALEYGGGSAVFTVRREGNFARISVRSAVSFCPPAVSTCSDRDAERGRGLFIVDALSEARDYTEEDGIRVFIRIR